MLRGVGSSVCAPSRNDSNTSRAKDKNRDIKQFFSDGKMREREAQGQIFAQVVGGRIVKAGRFVFFNKNPNVKRPARIPH